MAFRQDYIERLIQKMAEAIARAVGLARSGNVDEGIAALENAIASQLGMPLSMLLKLAPQTIVSMLGEEKARLLVDALDARAELERLADRTLEADQFVATAEALRALVSSA
jgi:hypothetical protein